MKASTDNTSRCIQPPRIVTCASTYITSNNEFDFAYEGATGYCSWNISGAGKRAKAQLNGVVIIGSEKSSNSETKTVIKMDGPNRTHLSISIVSPTHDTSTFECDASMTLEKNMSYNEWMKDLTIPEFTNARLSTATTAKRHKLCGDRCSHFHRLLPQHDCSDHSQVWV